MAKATGLPEAIGQAIALHQSGDLARARTLYQNILKSHPDQFDALYCWGVLELQAGRLEEAHRLLSHALDVNPDSADANMGLGNLLHAQNKLDAALECYDRALAIKPSFAEALNNRGNTLLDLRRYEEALESYDRAIAIAPGYAEAFNNRGNALHELKRYNEALASYDRALALAPRYASALNSRGNALYELDRLDEALASFDKALQIAPGYAVAYNNRGNALRRLNRYEEAIRDFECVLTVRPDYEYAFGLFVNLKMQCCDWHTHIADNQRLVADVQSGKRSTPPFSFLGISDSPQDQLLCSRIWARDKFPVSPPPTWVGERYCHDRIRIAYLSADLREHAVARLIAGLFEQHDKSRFETIAVSFSPYAPSEMETRLKSAFERFIDVREKSDREVANLLRELEIDIVVDLNGYTLHNRTGIFTLRPAPVQVNYLGYPGTLGADFIDYVIADRFIIPEQDHACYTEKVVYLPDTYQVNDSKRPIAKHTPSRSEAGLPEHGFVFCVFNNNFKITPVFFDIWMQLLRQVDGSVLWLLEDNPAVLRNLQREASARGISPARLVFAPRIRMEDHLARHRLADLFLDTLPYNAHTTASDALWAGLPVLTCVGTTFAGRVAASLLNAVGLAELITKSLEEYEALASKLANDPAMLAGVKAKLAANRESYPLFDTDRFRRHIEAAYITMWERSQRGEPPASFAVDPIWSGSRISF